MADWLESSVERHRDGLAGKPGEDCVFLAAPQDGSPRLFLVHHLPATARPRRYADRPEVAFLGRWSGPRAMASPIASTRVDHHQVGMRRGQRV